MRMFSSDVFKDKSERIPDSLWVAQMLKIGQNPAVIVERGRREMAKDALKKRNDLQKKIQKQRERYGIK